MKEALHQLANEWDKSLQIARPNYWKIEGIVDPKSFFQNLHLIFPHGGTILFEGLEIGLTAKFLYLDYPARYIGKVACDTLSPTPDSYHVEFTPEFSDKLCHFIASQGVDSVFYHFKGYSEKEIIFTFHDAFQGELIISRNLSADSVRAFASSLGLTAQPAIFKINSREQVIALDRAFNPPWWRRILNKLKKT